MGSSILRNRWDKMRERTNPKRWLVKPTYAGVTLSEEFQKFENFEAWALQQIGSTIRQWATDKDILVRGNKVYAPDRCVFVPIEVNNLIKSNRSSRGDTPIGVARHHARGFMVECNVGGGESVRKCGFRTAESAFQVYKEIKEAHIKRVAEKWRGQIDERAYAALMAWEINITD